MATIITSEDTTIKKSKKKHTKKSFLDLEAVNVNDDSDDEQNSEEYNQSDIDFINDNDSEWIHQINLLYQFDSYLRMARLKSYFDMYNSTAKIRCSFKPELAPFTKCFCIIFSFGATANSETKSSTSSVCNIFRFSLQLVEWDGNKISASLKNYFTII